MREYVEKTLHTRIDREAVDASGLPLYLRGLYSLEAALGTPVAFALEGATGYRVGRMLEAGLPFIEPSGQVYLPFLGIALSSGRSHGRDRRQADVGTFSPQAQRLALMALYGDLDGASVTQAAGTAAGMRGRPAFGHPVLSRRREGRPRIPAAVPATCCSARPGRTSGPPRTSTWSFWWRR